MPWNEATQAKYRRSDDFRQNDLTDEEWRLVAPLIPAQGRMGRPRSTDPRRVFDAIQYMLSSGCQWAPDPVLLSAVQHGAELLLRVVPQWRSGTHA